MRTDACALAASSVDMDRLLSFLASRNGKAALTAVACVGAAVGAYAAYRAVTAPPREAAAAAEPAPKPPAAATAAAVAPTPVRPPPSTSAADTGGAPGTPAADGGRSPPLRSPVAPPTIAPPVGSDDPTPSASDDTIAAQHDEMDLESLVPALMHPVLDLARPPYAAALSLAQGMTAHEVAMLLLLCCVAIAVYLVAMVARGGEGSAAPFVPVAWASLGYLAASGAVTRARVKSRKVKSIDEGDEGDVGDATAAAAYVSSPVSKHRAGVGRSTPGVSPVPVGRATPVILSPPRVPRLAAPPPAEAVMHSEEPAQLDESTAEIEAQGVKVETTSIPEQAPPPAGVAVVAAASDAAPSTSSVAVAGSGSSGDVPEALVARINVLVRAIDACDRSDEYEQADALLTAAVALLRTRNSVATAGGAEAVPESAGETDLPAGTPTLESTCTPVWLERYNRDYPPLPAVRTRLSAALLWRRARNCSKTGTWLLTHKLGPSPSASDMERVRQIYVLGLQAANESLRAYEHDADAHKFAGILSARAAADTKAKIANAYTIREHTLRAIELRPHDPVLQHIMGVWAFEVASLSWVSRQVASALFGRPPTATYDEALTFLLKSEELGSAPGGSGPMFGTRLKLAQTYMNMGNRAKATEWLRACAEVRVAAGEDPEDVRTAATLAAKLGVTMPPVAEV